METKACPDCGEEKALDDFPKHRTMPDGRGRYCRPCMSIRSKESYRRRQARKGKTVREADPPPEGMRRCPDCGEAKMLDDFPKHRSGTLGRATYCKPCHNFRGQETRQRLHGGSRHYHLVRRYGIGAADVERMIAEQGGLCAICREGLPEHVDHCHETGAVRGILCFNCNGGLGQFRDRVDILSRAITYLERTRDRQ